MSSIEGLTQQIWELSELNAAQVKAIDTLQAENKRLEAMLADLRGRLDAEKEQAVADAIAGTAEDYRKMMAAPGENFFSDKELESPLKFALRRPPEGYRDCSVVERNGQLIFLRDTDRLLTDGHVFYDGDYSDVLTPYDSRVQPPIPLAPPAYQMQSYLDASQALDAATDGLYGQQGDGELPPLPAFDWHAFCTKCSSDKGRFPAKPESYVCSCGYECLIVQTDNYSADQMREYGRLCLASRQSAPVAAAVAHKCNYPSCTCLGGTTSTCKHPNAQPPADAAPAFPPRDKTKPAEQQGIFEKFRVQRTDGSDAPGGKHHGCRYFVIDLDHDQYARAAMRAYAAACRATHPLLADDIEAEWGKADADRYQQGRAAGIEEATNWLVHHGGISEVRMMFENAPPQS